MAPLYLNRCRTLIPPEETGSDAQEFHETSEVFMTHLSSFDQYDWAMFGQWADYFKAYSIRKSYEADRPFFWDGQFAKAKISRLNLPAGAALLPGMAIFKTDDVSDSAIDTEPEESQGDEDGLSYEGDSSAE